MGSSGHKLCMVAHKAFAEAQMDLTGMADELSALTNFGAVTAYDAVPPLIRMLEIVILY